MSSKLQIPLQEIKLATKDFNKEFVIARGGFGNVFKVETEKYGIIAIKRLVREIGGQGDHEFKTEIALLSEYKHPNIVSLVGYCDEDGEKILVYKFESNGSLDRHLKKKDLSWIQRLNICLGAAQGLKYLHDDVGPHERIIHRDIKSANILLDDNWKPKVSDFGLSRITPANKDITFVITAGCGTLDYVDPYYFNYGYLTKESDVYSFGIVLFEVLCGRPPRVKTDGGKDYREFLPVLVRKHYESRTLKEIVYSAIRDQVNEASLLTFSNIAYQCLMSGDKRPTMKEVVQKLQKALDIQLALGEEDDDGSAALYQEQSRPHMVSSSQSNTAPARSLKYDVYLSFRGSDTRSTFADYLYASLVQHGIFTYKDDVELPRGEPIGPALLKAIQESQIAIIIFSENYAHSSRCLDELAEIMKGRDERGKIVVPIFYDVDPSDVRKQKGMYGEVFAKHELKNNSKVESWRKALVDASNIAGREPKYVVKGHESTGIKKIVEEILMKLPSLMPNIEGSGGTSVNTIQIGIETRMEELISLLKVGSGGVHMVGICGMWGSGKSTLASSVYDKIKHEFEGCCLVKNIRSESRMHGLKTLQEKILSHVLKSTVTVKSIELGMHMMKKRLRLNNFLIVLDDVDHVDHLKMLAGSLSWFGDGSRIIVTSRNQDLLNAHNVNMTHNVRMQDLLNAHNVSMTHNVRMLNVEEGVKVFSYYAFREGTLVKGYEKVSRNMVSKFRGHPLALINLCSFLKGRNMDEWKRIWDLLKDNPVDEILEKYKPEGDDGVTRDFMSWMLTELS